FLINRLSKIMNHISNTLLPLCACLYVAIFILGLIGNGLVILVTAYKMKTSVNSIWFLHLVFADFSFIFSPVLNITKHHMNDFICRFLCYVMQLIMFASIFFLTVINNLPVYLVGCSLPLVIFRKTHSNSLQQTLCIPGFSSLEAYKRVLVFRFLVGFLIPFVIILASYMAIGVRVKRLRKDNKLKPLRIILAVILAFFFCWLPFYFYKFLKMGLFIVSLAYLNSCLNPFFCLNTILYVFMCDEYKKKLKQSLLLVLETAFAEDHLDFKADAKG
uniref:G-protein coupled receptors family 1 profile domain-containing protein n=1 Tax=Sinocyclocheilus grahami TaxID=75366 RepID=A0A672JZY9_SINGR